MASCSTPPETMNAIPPQARSAKLLIQTVGDELVIYDRRSLHFRRLNRTAAVIWRHCDGRRSVADLVALARAELDAPKLPARVVEQALAKLEKTDLLREVLARSRRAAPPSRRSARGRCLLSAHVPVVASILAPTPLMTASGEVGAGSPCETDSDCEAATDGAVVCVAGACTQPD